MKRLSITPSTQLTLQFEDELQQTRRRCNELQERLALIEMYLFTKLNIKIPEMP